MRKNVRQKVLYEGMIPDAERLGDHYLKLLLVNRIRRLGRDQMPPVERDNLILFPKAFIETCDCMAEAPNWEKVILQSAMIPFSIALTLFALIKMTHALYSGPGV